jgi:chaperonin cofactor prefoldin
MWHTCVAMSLNIRRIVRQQVETRLDAQQMRIGTIQEQLSQIEAKLDRLLGTEGKP